MEEDLEKRTMVCVAGFDVAVGRFDDGDEVQAKTLNPLSGG